MSATVQVNAKPQRKRSRSRQRKVSISVTPTRQRSRSRSKPRRRVPKSVRKLKKVVAKEQAIMTGSSLGHLAQTRGGAEWAIRVIHPCGEGLAFGKELPDGTYTRSSSLCRDDEYELIMPEALNAVNATLWTCIILEFPVLLGHTVVIVPHGIQSTGDALYTNLCQVISTLWLKDAEKYPTWTAIAESTDPGAGTWYVMMLTSSIWPNLGSITVTSLTANDPSNDFRNLRRTFCGLTAQLNAPALSDNGRLISGQFGTDCCRVVVSSNPATANPNVNQIMTMIEIPPVLERDVAQTDALGCLQTLAKEGCYMPIRPANEFGDMVKLNTPCGVAFNHKSTIDTIPGNESTMQGDYYLKNWSVGVMQFVDIASTAGIRLKRLEGIEGSPQMGTICAAFQADALAKDARAFEFVSEFCRVSPHAFPAAYNEDDLMSVPIDCAIEGGCSNLIGSLRSGRARRTNFTTAELISRNSHLIKPRGIFGDLAGIIGRLPGINNIPIIGGGLGLIGGLLDNIIKF